MQAYTRNNKYKALEKTILTSIFKIARTPAQIIFCQKYAYTMYFISTCCFMNVTMGK